MTSNRANKATRYATVIVWASGNVEDSAAFGSIDKAVAWAKRQEKRDCIQAVYIRDRKPPQFARRGWLD